MRYLRTWPPCSIAAPLHARTFRSGSLTTCPTTTSTSRCDAPPAPKCIWSIGTAELSCPRSPRDRSSGTTRPHPFRSGRSVCCGRSAAKDIAPSIEYVTLPGDPPLSIVHCVLPEVVRTLPVPGDYAVVDCIVQNGGFCGIEILHRTQAWRRHHAFTSWLALRISGRVEPYAGALSIQLRLPRARSPQILDWASTPKKRCATGRKIPAVALLGCARSEIGLPASRLILK